MKTTNPANQKYAKVHGIHITEQLELGFFLNLVSMILKLLARIGGWEIVSKGLEVFFFSRKEAKAFVLLRRRQSSTQNSAKPTQGVWGLAPKETNSLTKAQEAKSSSIS
jgi:hypothetical protein